MDRVVTRSFMRNMHALRFGQTRCAFGMNSEDKWRVWNELRPLFACWQHQQNTKVTTKHADVNWFFAIATFSAITMLLCGAAYPWQQLHAKQKHNNEHRSIGGGCSSVNHGKILYTFYGMTRTNILSSAQNSCRRNKKMQRRLELVPFRNDKYSDCIRKAAPPDVPINIRVG